MIWLKKYLLPILLTVFGLLLLTNIIIHYWDGWSFTLYGSTLFNNLVTPIATIISIGIYTWTLWELIKQNRISHTVLRIAMHDFKQKIKPELEAYYRISYLSMNQPDGNLIMFSLKNKSLGKARIQSVNSSGCIIVKSYNSEVELELNQECYVECSVEPLIFQSVIGDTNQFCNGNLHINKEDEFKRRVGNELNKSKLHIGFADELGNKYYVPLAVDRAKMGSIHYSEVVFTGEPISNSH